MIPILEAFLPQMTAATSAIGGTAPLAIIMLEIGVATEARFVGIRAHIAAPPKAMPILSLAAVLSLVVVREEEEEGEEQQSAPL